MRIISSYFIIVVKTVSNTEYTLSPYNKDDVMATMMRGKNSNIKC